MSLNVLTQGGGTGGASASIFITGLTASDVVTATKDSKTVKGKWVEKLVEVDTEIPTMTSNTAPSGSASASTTDSGFPAYYAFTGIGSNGWAPSSNDSFGNAYVQYEFEEPIVPSKISVANIKASNELTFTYKVTASQDSQVWDTLIESVKTTTMGVFFDTEVNTTKSYKYFRLVILATSGTGISSGNGHKFQVYGTKTETTAVHEITKINSYGTWAVEATDGKRTTTQDVLVDAAVEYEIEMSYKLWLYREGDECEDVTGGWYFYDMETQYGSYITEKRSDHIYAKSTANSSTGAVLRFRPTNSIDLTPYKKMYFDFSVKHTDNYERGVINLVGDDKTIGVYTIGKAASRDRSVLEYDVSALTGLYYLRFSANTVTSGNYSEVSLYRCWLE